MLEIQVDVRRRDYRYDILVGGFLPEAWLGTIEARVPSRQYVAVIDSQVAAARLVDGAAARPGWRAVRIEAGESNKGLANYAALCERLLALGIDRDSVVVAVGGGVTGDLAGFAAATLLRGIRVVQMPTTLLAQVDSSVGGKTGVNLAGGKNLLGAFYQPALVLIDPAFLATLPEREYLAGLAEVVKYGLIGDREFFDRLEREADALARRDPGTLAEVVAHCCRMKADIAGSDEREAGQRGLLNLGHTFGHALEALAGFDGRVVHGEAVAVGMALAAGFAAGRGLMQPAEAERVAASLARHRLPARIRDLGVDWDTVMRPDPLKAALAKDKKAAAAGLTLVLPHAIGDTRLVKKVPVEEVAEFMLGQS